MRPDPSPSPADPTAGAPCAGGDVRVPSLVVLHGGVQHYAWGSVDELPAFLGIPADGRPVAEWWLGDHPLLPSMVAVPSSDDGAPHDVPLDDVLASSPEHWTGSVGGLPFLLKVLSIAAPLSLQVHPTREQAADGFRREEAAGVELHAPERNYRDDNHKPELIVALTAFDALCGFAPVEEAVGRLRTLAGDAGAAAGADAGADHAAARRALADLADRLAADPTADTLRAVVGDVLRAPSPLAAGWTEILRRDAPATDAAHLAALAERYPGDPGVVVAALLNHVVLQPGEGLFLDAGELHAYLRGFGLELMASSDNVLRGGMTAKHVDVDELLRVLVAHPQLVSVLRPEAEGAEAEAEGTVRRWPLPTGEFALWTVEAERGAPAVRLPGPGSPRIVVCTEGSATLRARTALDDVEDVRSIRRGEALLVAADATVEARVEPGRDVADAADAADAVPDVSSRVTLQVAGVPL